MTGTELIEKTTYFPLAQRVLAVCVAMYMESGKLLDWVVYVDSVQGNDHEKEYLRVIMYGDKIRISIAKAIFPHLDITKYRL